MERLSLSLLGPLQIALDGRLAGGFAYNKGRALLIYLAVEADRAHHRDALVGLLWPDLPDTAARTNLRQTLTNLREAIGDATAAPPFLRITRDTIQLNPSSGYELDMISFTALLDACATHSHRHLARCRSCAARMQQALAHYRGDFLAEFALGDSAPFDEWALRHREQLHQRALDALAHLADYHERCGDDEPARRYAQRQIELDPWREEAHRQLMRLLTRGGQRSAALAQYETCRRILARDLDVEPATETTALYEQIRDKETRRQGDKEASMQVGAQPLSLSPPLLVAPAPRHNFPAQTTPLIGRETELAELGSLLENPACRLITITGPGGIGKTRLALAAATEQAQAFANGAAFVPLAAISAAEFVASAIMAALGHALQGQRDQLLDYLRAKELLIVLDNFEQLLGPGVSHNNSAADLLTDMLQHAPNITLVITSRERLALHGEWLFDLPGLSYPTGKLVDDVESYSSAQLFLQRAGQVRRHFALVEGEARAVAHICRLVEGLPLAIELAAAALRVRSCAAIADAIETNLLALTTELRSIPERHRSIWATFEYSWGLLSDEERQIFPRLSVFRGGFTLEAAAAVQSAKFKMQSSELSTTELLTRNSELLTLLAALVDKSLLRWDGAARYEMHELVREYALERLRAAGEEIDVRRRHAAFFAAWVEAVQPSLRGDDLITSERLGRELGNFRAALEWSLARPADEDALYGLRLFGSIWNLWWLRYPTEGGAIAERALVCASTRHQDLAVARIYNAAARLQKNPFRSPQGIALLQRSLALARQYADRLLQVEVLRHLGEATHDEDLQVAESFFAESLRISRELNDAEQEGWTTLGLGRVAAGRGDLAEAERCYQHSLALFIRLDYTFAQAVVLRYIAGCSEQRGDNAAADRYLARALALFDRFGLPASFSPLIERGRLACQRGDYQRALDLLRPAYDQLAQVDGDHLGMVVLMWQAVCHLELGDLVAAMERCRQALVIALKNEEDVRVIQIAMIVANVAVAGGKHITAARLLRCADSYLATTSYTFEYDVETDWKRLHDRAQAACRAQLDAPTFAAAWAEGRALTLEQAIAEALAEAPIGNEVSA